MLSHPLWANITQNRDLARVLCVVVLVAGLICTIGAFFLLCLAAAAAAGWAPELGNLVGHLATRPVILTIVAMVLAPYLGYSFLWLVHVCGKCGRRLFSLARHQEHFSVRPLLGSMQNRIVVDMALRDTLRCIHCGHLHWKPRDDVGMWPSE